MVKHLLLASVMLYSTQSMAFSSQPYEPVDWSTSSTPAEDASYALDNDDSRLIGFALRGYSIPGVEATQTQAYIDSCGIRVLESFGDVLRDGPQRDAMKRASRYAEEYNGVILQHCRAAEK